MSATNKKHPTGKRESSRPVPFKTFQRLIVNLPEIAEQLKAADGGSKTVNYWTRWYYEEFYRNPSIRERYAFKVGACPRRTRMNLLKVPETHSHTEASQECPLVAVQSPSLDTVKVESDSSFQETPTRCQDIIVEVDKAGTFLFPVSFRTFEHSLNKMEVFKRIAKSEDLLKLAADDGFRKHTLQRFYNRFYMHPEKRSTTNLFKEVSQSLLAKLLESGRPFDKAKSTAEYAAKKTLESNSIVPFELFKENLLNLSDIVEQMKQKDKNYESKDFHECAFDFYLAFYITPEIREKYEFQLVACTTVMKARMLANLSKEVAEELRLSLPQLGNPSPALELPGSESSVESPAKAKDMNENLIRSPEAKESAQEPDLEVLDGMPHVAASPPGLELPACNTPSKDSTETATVNQIPENFLFETDVEVNVKKSGRFLFPVSFETFWRYINYKEIIRINLMRHITQNEAELEKLIADPSNPQCKKVCRQSYNKFYILNEKYRKTIPYKFECADSKILNKLLEIAKPLDEAAIKTMSLYAPKDKKEKTKKKPKSKENPKACNMDKPEEEFPPCPISFEVFKRHVSNLDDICNEMQLCEEFRGKSKKEVAQLYYQGFYSGQEMRDKFVCRFKPCPSKMLKKLLSFPQNNGGVCPKEPDCQVVGITEKPCEESQKESNGQAGFAVQPSQVVTEPEVKDKDPVELRESHYEERAAEPSHISNESNAIITEVTSKLPQLATSPPRLELAAFKTPETSSAETASANKISESFPFKTNVEVNVGSLGRFLFPVSCDTFRHYINDEFIRTNLMRNITKNEAKLAELMADPSNPQCKKVFLRSYKNFYIQNEKYRKTIPYKFDCTDPKILNKLLEIAKPLDEAAIKTMSLYTVKDEKENTNAPKLQVVDSPEKPGQESFSNPVSLEVFKRHVSNLDVICYKMLLCDEFRGKSREDVIQHYYQGFYSGQNMRDRFVVRFKSCPSSMLQKLMSFPPNNREVCPKEPDCQVVCITEKSCDESQKEPEAKEQDPVEPIESHLEQRVAEPSHTSNECNPVMTISKEVNDEPPHLATSPAGIEIAFKSPETSSAETEKLNQIAESFPFKTDVEVIVGSLGRFMFPVSCDTFRRYINNEFIRTNLMINITKNEAKLTELMADPSNPICKKVFLRSYKNFYIQHEKFRKTIPYKFDCTDPKILMKLLEVAKPLDETAIKTMSLHVSEKPCMENPESNCQAEFAISKDVKKISTCLAEESNFSRITPEKPIAAPNQRQLEPEARPKCPSATSEVVTEPEVEVQGPYHISEECNTARILERARKRAIDVVKFEVRRLFANNSPEMQETLKKQFKIYCLAQEGSLQSDTNSTNVDPAAILTKGNEPVITSNPMEIDEVSKDPERAAFNENELQKSSNLPEVGKTISDSAETIASEGQTNKEETQAELSNIPESSKGSSENISTDKDELTRTDGDLEAASNSPQSTESQILLEQAKNIFFAENNQDHNMKYLISTSQGLMRTIWRILYQLTLQEFCHYTSIHDGEALYKCDEHLQLCFQHVVVLGNWPINLHVRLGFLKQLLLCKGVRLDKIELSQLSPKILSPWELGSYSDFDKIVEQHYTHHTGKKIDDVVQLCQEREKLYAACWTHNQWILQVPEISDEVLNEEIEEAESVIDGISLRPICVVKSRDVNTPTEVVSIASSPNTICEETSCPPTQLIDSSFVDVSCVEPASQVPQMTFDPLIPEETSQMEEAPIEYPPTTTVLVTVKQEPIKLPNNQRATICNSEDCQWEEITTQEQIIDLDASQSEEASLSCFAISKPTEKAAEETLNLLENSNIPIDAYDIPEILEVPVPVEVAPRTVASTSAPQVPRKRQAATRESTSKKIRLNNERVPQLRHEFPPLPMGVMVRIESGGNRAPECQPAKPPSPPSNSTAQPTEVNITPSQDFATGNTLLECSQLQHLLDSTNVNTRQVIEEATDKVRAAEPLGASPLQRSVVFRDLDRFSFFNSLTVQQITKFRIEGHLQGSSYQDALVRIDDRLCNVRGPLLSCLFPHLTSALRSDLEYVLRDLGEFCYKSTWPAHKDATVDLRTRVLSAFINVSPRFGPFRIQFDNATREWGTCSEVGNGEPEILDRETSCNAAEFINPRILNRIRELKQLID
ncbi:protein telomere ends associated isoform X5 [Drosophila takahashii]|uniref:protein telomere ends associated isoform X5 n=1 Tax=Drosophila takahashii TaxID=29030 RepID=UPI003898D96F